MQIVKLLLKDWWLEPVPHVQHCCVHEWVKGEHRVPGEEKVAPGWGQGLQKFSPFYNCFRLSLRVFGKAEFV